MKLIEMAELEYISADEGSNALILEEYKYNLIERTVDTYTYTKEVVQNTGDNLGTILVMAKVNALVRNKNA
jgi:hypothetical protein